MDLWCKVEIISDHNPLKYLNQTTPKSPKLTRWHWRYRDGITPLLTGQVGRVRNYCLHLATGRTRDEIEKRIWQRERKKVGTEEAGVEKSRGREK
ncbi:hypothetical protein TNCV_265141 [Trichonephila clavipes]|nr:hypothetical protein TNCV_265141 [Trichonephila clavipes]